MLNAIDKKILETVADIHDVPQGAYNIRKNGKGESRKTTKNIDIVTKTDKPGIDVIIKSNTKNESVHVPVILSATGLTDVVYNSFFVGENCDVVIVAGCGIHNSGCAKTQHDGIHDFHVGKNSHVKYIEKHYGEGEGTGGKVLNPKTTFEVEDGGFVELEMVQIKGVDNTIRDTEVTLHKNARVIVTEKLLTYLNQEAESNITVDMEGENSSAQIISRSVAQGNSSQKYHFNMIGNNKCKGHTQCDAIIMDNAKVVSIPEISAFNSDAQLIHEAAIGKIASEQIIKLMSLGLTEKEAEETILEGFLK